MKPFKDYLSENISDAERDRLFHYHDNLASLHDAMSKHHKKITHDMSNEFKEKGTPAPKILQHKVAESGHKDAAKWHSYAASMYRMKQIDSAKEFSVQAENASKAANNRSKSLE